MVAMETEIHECVFLKVRTRYSRGRYWFGVDTTTIGGVAKVNNGCHGNSDSRMCFSDSPYSI